MRDDELEILALESENRALTIKLSLIEKIKSRKLSIRHNRLLWEIYDDIGVLASDSSLETALEKL